MRRYLLCPSCGDKFTLCDEDRRHGIEARKVKLIAKRPEDLHPELVCDFCNTSIPDGSKATALTLYDTGKQPERWESEYGGVIP